MTSIVESTTDKTPALNKDHQSDKFEEERWEDLYRIIDRSGPFAHSSRMDGDFTKKFLQTQCRVLIVGAGGLGCDLLKNLAMSGFKKLDIIDMDVIDKSNLNRQFLFRDKDVGQSKAITAAAFVNARVPGVEVTPHYCKIEDKDLDFYQQFHIVICGLDSVQARDYINELFCSMVRYVDAEEKIVDMSTAKPILDGGTEGFKGQARFILPKVNSCYSCTKSLLPSEDTYPLCTIKAKPRLPEHCIQYAILVEWDNVKNKPGIRPDEQPDRDNPKHLKWIFEKAKERADQCGISGVTFQLCQNVIKRIIPVFAATNAIIASMCTNEALKIATLCAKQMDDYCQYSGEEGIYTYTYKNEKNTYCPVCGIPHKRITLSSSNTLADLLEIVKKDKDIDIEEPSSISFNTGGEIYMKGSTTSSQDDLKSKPLSEIIGHDDIIRIKNIIKTHEVTIRYFEAEEQEGEEGEEAEEQGMEQDAEEEGEADGNGSHPEEENS